MPLWMGLSERFLLQVARKLSSLACNAVAATVRTPPRRSRWIGPERPFTAEVSKFQSLKTLNSLMETNIAPDSQETRAETCGENGPDLDNGGNTIAIPNEETEANTNTAGVSGEVQDTKPSGFRRKHRKRKENRKNLHMTFKRPRLTSNETMEQTEYYFENGLRKVVPYDYRYNSFCKGRWVGKTIGELYTSEFRLHSIEYYAKALKEGRLLVNLKPADSLQHILKDNDLLTSLAHRHECPISNEPVQVIADTNEFFVVNKPCTLPIHPVGRFRHNCLITILAKEFDKKGIYSIHRLDRMTSGLVVFTKSKEKAGKCHRQIRDRQVKKEYLCRVIGDFTKFQLPVHSEHRIKVEGDIITINEPLKVYDVKVGTTIVSHDEDAKEAETIFKCLFTDGKTSVVRCEPKTGRTHQIRVHLQYLGYPIVNDDIYNHPVWGEGRFCLGPITTPMDEVTQGLTDMKKWVAIAECGKETEEERETSIQSATPQLSPALEKVVSTMKDAVPYRPECEECRHPLSDPQPHELVMYLHALRYKGPDWEFETPVPDWAKPDWDEVEDKT